MPGGDPEDSFGIHARNGDLEKSPLRVQNHGHPRAANSRVDDSTRPVTRTTIASPASEGVERLEILVGVHGLG